VLFSEYRKRPPHLRSRWLREKRGFGDAIQETAGETVWIHAVSVGEVLAAVPFIKALRARCPSMRIVVSTITDTGQKIAGERFGDFAHIVYMPFDLPSCLNRFLDTIRPKLFLIMETELWPNAVRICHERAIPVALINGRISERSYRGYRKMRFFMGEVFRRMSALCVQNDVYAERLRALGAFPTAVHADGNMKFDLQLSGTRPAWTARLSGPVVLAGSTHSPEEEIILTAYQKALTAVPALNLILAPRHPERFDEVEGVLRKSGMKYMRRSVAEQESEALHGMVILLDAMGELGATYAAADIAIMGGSFIPHGGQNLLEPAFWGKAILCGPHMHNFPFVQDFYEAGAARRVTDESLAGELVSLLSSPAAMHAMGDAARALLARNAGATERTLDRVSALLVR
jgi:3-deoxy-D-manno-octulosonic-acid transferase